MKKDEENSAVTRDAAENLENLNMANDRWARVGDSLFRYLGQRDTYNRRLRQATRCTPRSGNEEGMSNTPQPA